MVRHIIQSFGCGTQSVAILTLIAQGKLTRPERIVMSDTTYEATVTWDYLDEIVRPLTSHLGIPLDIVREADGNYIYTAKDGNESMLLPAFTLTGKLSAFCSGEWKRDPVKRHLRKKGYGPSKPILQWFGMSFDELDRMRKSRRQWIQHGYPLVDMRLRRDEAIERIRRYGLPVPPRSSCKI
jgi:3'-phosphoadenosine 5'-phosphosulfate sulfotransferase (PAPS reductase)/FAD synthetase